MTKNNKIELLNAKEKKYCWSFDKGNWAGCGYDSIDECIEDARKEMTDDVVKGTIYVAEEIPYLPEVSLETIMEQLEETAFDDIGYMAEDWDAYDPRKKEEVKELKDKLNRVIYEWMDKYGYAPYFFTVENEKEYRL